MRRVAQELDTGPASLYAYVRNTAELHAAVLDELLGALEVRARGSWVDRLEQLLTDYLMVLAGHTGLARSALLLRPSGPNVLALYDRMLGLLLAGGVEAGRASWGVDLLVLTATATAAEHAAPEATDADAPVTDDEKASAVDRAVRTADPTRTPHLAHHAALLLGGTHEQRWRWTVRAQIAGIAATPLPDAPATALPDAPNSPED
jgi:AcrR family transcriptional regulator